MKSSSPQRRKQTLRAKAATMDHQTEYDDYGPEPNMKLSHAFMVVLALHVIAVGGLFAFNKVKANHAKKSSALASESLTTNKTEASAPPSAEASAAHNEQTMSPASPKVATTNPPASAKTTPTGLAKIGAIAPTTAPIAATTAVAAQSATTTTGGPQPPPPASSTTTMPVAGATPVENGEQPALSEYTVVKGDNPYKIAKKFHVSYDALMKINNITDPRKIQIGQKLKIPAKKNKS
ncbi:MAG: LysM peptidoglycan-binding domain-containing protein [Chthoniobacterales bacterium]